MKRRRISVFFFIFFCFLLEYPLDASEIKQKNVLVIMNKLPAGGAEKALVNMLNYSSFSDIRFELCLFEKKGELLQILRKDIPVISLQEAKKKQYDVAISYLEGIKLDAWVNTIKAKKRIQWVHTDLGKSKWRRRFFKSSEAKKIDFFVCVSEATKKSLCLGHPELFKKIRVITNIINGENIRKEAEHQITDLPKRKGVLNIVTVARLSREKGIDRAVSICKKLCNQGFSIRWYVVGDGEERKHIEKLIAKKSLKKNFMLLGTKKNPYPYFKEADIFVLPSFFEGRSIVISEAQIVGIPIIATDVGGIREQIIPGTNGTIVANSEEAIYKGLKFLLRHAEVRHKYRQALQQFKYNNEKSLEQIHNLMK